MPTFVHSDTFLLSAYALTGTVLAAGDAAGTRQAKASVLLRLALAGERQILN